MWYLQELNEAEPADLNNDYLTLDLIINWHYFVYGMNEKIKYTLKKWS